MRKLVPLVLVVSALMFAGCAGTSKRTVYNTLATVGKTTDAAMKSYLDLIVRGQISTKSLPDVSHKYTVFQASYSLALTAAQMNPNAVAPGNVVADSINVINAVESAKVAK